jgi:hypothetical protein
VQQIQEYETRPHRVSWTCWRRKLRALRLARWFDKAMLRIPEKYGHFVFGAIQAGLTSAIAAGVASISFFGTIAFVEIWLHSWLIAWMTAIPIVLVAASGIRRLVLALTVGSGDGGKGI